MPGHHDVDVTIEDAAFFLEKLASLARGNEAQQDLDMIRRYFRGYLQCWKSALHFVREIKTLKEHTRWITWIGRLRTAGGWSKDEVGVWEGLRKLRDNDTHHGLITTDREIAAGLFPIAMITPPGGLGRR